MASTTYGRLGAPQNSWAQGWVPLEDMSHPASWRVSTDPSLHRLSPRVFGQIESKSMDWAVRATDDANYYAMKFAAGWRAARRREHGPLSGRGGCQGRSRVHSLNIMIHEHTAYHWRWMCMAIGSPPPLKARRSIASWTARWPAAESASLPMPANRPRLYWIKVSKNEDWLGRVAPFLSGGSSDTRAVVAPAGTLPSPGSGAPVPANQFALAAGFGLMPQRVQPNLRSPEVFVMAFLTGRH